MKCMRCGTEIQESAVFCEECLAEMEKHPVDPNTPVNLPRREKHIPIKRNRKRHLKPEEMVKRLRRIVIALMAVILALAIALTASLYLLLTPPEKHPNLLPGQNYGTQPADS